MCVCVCVCVCACVRGRGGALTWVQSLGWEDSPGEGMTTHSSILAWRTPWAEEPGVLQSMRSQRVGHNSVTNTFIEVRLLVN